MSFSFGDQVRVLSAERTPEYADHVGLIVGIGEDEGEGLSYAVSFPDGAHTASFWESELEPFAAPAPLQHRSASNHGEPAPHPHRW